MVDNGTIVYDYGAIEDCIGQMVRTVDGITSETGNLESSAKKALAGWTGATADAYTQLFGDLTNKLQGQVSNLDTLQKKLEASAAAMQDADKKGGRSVAAS